MPANQGKFVWYELMTPDPAAAEGFYSSVIGWDVEHSDISGTPYTVFSAAGNRVAGMMALPEGGHPAWLGHIGVDNIDDGLGQVTGAGGKIYHPASDIPNIGKFAVVADPQGAAFMLFQSTSVPGEPNDPHAPGQTGWHELYAIDYEKAFEFYSGLYGWVEAGIANMGAMGNYQMFSVDGHVTGGMMNKPAMVPAPGWLYYFNVASADEAVFRIEAGGGKVMHGPQEVPGNSWIVQALDPQGVLFAVVAPKP